MKTFEELIEELRAGFSLDVPVHHGAVVERELICLLRRVWNAAQDNCPRCGVDSPAR